MDATDNSTQEKIQIDVTNLSLGFVVSVLIFSGQVTVFVALCRKKSSFLSTDYFVASLALADTVVSVICVPGWTLKVALTEWPLPMVLCNVWLIIDYSFCAISVYTVLFISVERFLGILYPLRYGLKRSSSKTKCSLIALWSVTLVVFLTFFLCVQKQDDQENICDAVFLRNSYMVFVYVIFAVWIPFVTSVVAYVIIWIKIRKQYKFRRHGSEDIEIYAHGVEVRQMKRRVSPFGQHCTRAKHDGYEIKAVKSMALLVGALGVCVLPLSFMFAVSSIKSNLIGMQWVVSGYWLTYLNSFFNPMCYCLGNPVYRRLLCRH